MAYIDCECVCVCVCVSGQVFRDGHAADVDEEVWFSGEHVEECQQNRTVYSETVTIDTLYSISTVHMHCVHVHVHLKCKYLHVRRIQLTQHSRKANVQYTAIY